MPVVRPPARVVLKTPPKDQRSPGCGLRARCVPKKRQLPTATPLSLKNEPLGAPLEEVLRVASRYFSQGSAGYSHGPAACQQSLSAHEAEALKKVAATWQDMRQWRHRKNLIAARLTATEMAPFFTTTLDLSLVLASRTPAHSAVTLGQRQAPWCSQSFWPPVAATVGGPARMLRGVWIWDVCGGLVSSAPDCRE